MLSVPAAMELQPDGPLELVGTLRVLVRGLGDRTIRVSRTSAWWTTRTPMGPATIHVRHDGSVLRAAGWGPGASHALARVPAWLGIAPGSAGVADLDAIDDGRVRRLARPFRGVRLTRTTAILESLVPAILEQKVTGTEARRAWQGLVAAYGEAAPRPPDDRSRPEGPPTDLRVTPDPAILAALPYHAFHRFGIEQRRATVIRQVASEAAWLEAASDLPLPDAAARLQSIPGIGPWTTAEVAVRALGDPDAVSVGDFHLPNLVAFALAGEARGDDARMLELLEPFRGRRALVVRVLELSGLRAPRYGPRLSPRRIETI